MVEFFIEMELEDRLVPMRVPKRYLEDRFDHTEGAVHGAQLFSVSVPTFEPITRQETGRRNAAGLPWDWMTFLVHDLLPLDQTVGLQLTLPISYADIGKPRSVPDVHEFPNEPGPYGLTRIVAPDRLGGEQKGSIENLNKRARRDLPRDAPVAALSNRDIKAICDRLNGTPRKCLGWRTPTEAFRDELMKLR